MRWLETIALGWALSLWAPVAAADAVPPPPTNCVEGSYGETCHGGPHCRPRACSDDGGCEPGESCQPLALCIDQIDCGGQGGPFFVDEVTGSCPGGSCAEGTCQGTMVCAPTGSTGTRMRANCSGVIPGAIVKLSFN